jgi:hypothetical protein
MASLHHNTTCDGCAQVPPPGVRVAWLRLDADEDVPAGVDLVFRVHGLRRNPAKRIGLTLVCPVEQGSGAGTTCSTCGVCWR